MDLFLRLCLCATPRTPCVDSRGVAHRPQRARTLQFREQVVQVRFSSPSVLLPNSSLFGTLSKSTLVRTRFSRQVRPTLSAVACLFFFSAFAQAQVSAAHFSGSFQLIGSGFYQPYSVVIDGSGNLFVADYGNNAVKELTAASGYTITTTLGSGLSHPSGLAVDRSGNVFVADSSNNAVKELTAASGYTAVTTLGHGFNAPTDVAVDANSNVFVADYGNNAIKMITAAGGYAVVHHPR